jgi:hypothetical protein
VSAVELHPVLAPVAHLLGDWEGEGHGAYPTIDDFAYVERLTFGHVGKPFLSYLQRTWAPDRGPLHTEVGYVRVIGPVEGGEGIAVEMVIAQPSGITEVLVGSVLDQRLDLRSTAVATTPTAKPVEATARRLALLDGVLVTDTEMAAVGHPLGFHLHSELRPVPAA